MVFLVAPGTEKSYLHDTENVKTSGIGIGFDRILKFARVAKIFEKT